MNIRWLWLDYVPPELGLSREEYRRRRRCVNHDIRWRLRSIGVVLLVCVFVVAPANAGIIWWLVRSAAKGGLNSLQLALAAALAGAVCPLICFVLIAWLARWTHRPLVLDALQEMGHEVCRNCNQILRGLSDETAVCPECETPREPMPQKASS